MSGEKLHDPTYPFERMSRILVMTPTICLTLTNPSLLKYNSTARFGDLDTKGKKLGTDLSVSNRLRYMHSKSTSIDVACDPVSSFDRPFLFQTPTG